MKVYNLALPFTVYKALEKLAKIKKCSPVDVCRKFIKLGFLASVTPIYTKNADGTYIEIVLWK